MSELINPYIAGAPVTETRMFFGREDVFDWIQNSLSGRYADHILVIHGQRRVGKTSVLKQLGNRLPDKYIPVFFDLQGRTHTTLDRFLWWLAREIVRVLKQERDITFPVPEKEAFTADPEYFETRFLPSLRPHIADQSLLLTFDEFDNLEESEIKEELARPLIDYLRRMMGEEGISFIFSIGSSGRKLENMQASYTEFFKTALYKKISFLSREQTAGLVTGPVEGLLEYERQAVERIFEITSGHPYFTQLTCHELFSLCQRTGELHIREIDVEAILEDVVERGTVNLKFTWDEASDLEKWCLAVLAHHDDPLNNRALGDFLRKQHVRFSDSDLTSGLLHLREKDVLTDENRFVIHLLKLWLRKNRTIEQVREELTEVNPIANRFIEIGLEFQDSRLYDKAVENFREALAIAPENIQAQVNIALAYMAQKDLSQAVAEFEKALAMDDEDVASRSGLCEAYLALGDTANKKDKPRDAIQSYQKVLSINAEHTEARQRMAEISLGRAEKALADGRDEEALAAFAEALRFTPEDEELSARYEQAKVEKRTKVLASLLAKADKEHGNRNWEAALKILENALEIAPGEEKVQARITTIKAEQRKEQLQAILVRADRAERAGRWGLVIAALEEHLTLEPEDAQIQARIKVARQKLTEAQVEEARSRARNLARQERFEEAITAWNEYLKINPSDGQTVQAEIEKVRKAQVLAQNYADAQKAFSRKNYEKAVSLLRGIVVENADYKEATRLIAEAIELRRTVRKWWQNKWMWGGVVGAVVLIVGWFAFRPGSTLLTPPASPPLEVTATAAAPIMPPLPTNTPEPTSTPGPTSTPLPFAWARLNSGQFLPRDQVAAIVIDSTDPGVMYVGTNNAGIYKSIDGGLSWQPMQAGLGAANIGALVISPDDPRVLYAGANNLGVYKTADGGQTWQAINQGLGDVPPPIALLLDPRDSRHLYFSTNRQLYETTDGGETWEEVSFHSDCSPPDLYALAIAPGQPDVLLAVEGGSSGCQAGLYRSDDSGNTWNRLPSTTDEPYQPGLLAIDTGDANILYATTGRELYISQDGGNAWESSLAEECLSLVAHPELGGIAYCSSYQTVYRTIDSSKTWQALGRSAIDVGQIKALAGIAGQPGAILAGGNGLYATSNDGDTWSALNNGLGSARATLSISPGDALYVSDISGSGESSFFSTDQGRSWDAVAANVMVSLGADGFLYRFANGELSRSQDHGQKWEAIPASIPSVFAPTLLAHPTQPDQLYLFHLEGEPYLHLSQDGGATWQPTEGITEGAPWARWALFADHDQGQRMYVLEMNAHMFRSDDSGSNWRTCNRPNAYIDAYTLSNTSLAVDPRNADRMYLATQGNGVLLSQDGCQSWEPGNSGLGGLFVNTLAIDPNNPDTVYAGTDGGAYISYDAGATWGQVNDGLLGATVVYSIAVDKDGNVYAATPYGIFKLEGQ